MAPEDCSEQTSKEATTTRPKPFDDDDASLRKRRRTGSPLEMESDIRSPKPQDVLSVSDDSNDVTRPVSMPQTSQRSSSPSSSLGESPVKKLTVHIRDQSGATAPGGDSAQFIGRMLSPSPSAQEDNEATTNSTPNILVDHALTPTTQKNARGRETSKPEPMSESAGVDLSPDPSLDQAGDPAANFPYHSNGDPTVTLNRFCNYLSSGRLRGLEVLHSGRAQLMTWKKNALISRSSLTSTTGCQKPQHTWPVPTSTRFKHVSESIRLSGFVFQSLCLY